MTRLPGKKLRKERFAVDSVAIDLDLRITDRGAFFIAIDDNCHVERATLLELREAVQPILEQIHRLTWDPFIRVEYEDAESNSRFDNRRGDANRQELTLAFQAGYVSQTAAAWRSDEAPRRRWADATVDDVTCEIAPLADQSRRDAGTCWDTDDLIEFTPQRWRALTAIAAAIADVRVRIATLLEAKNGRLLDAMPVGDRMLSALPAPDPDLKRQGGRR